MEEAVASPSTAGCSGSGGSETVDQGLENELKLFIQSDEKTSIIASNVRFNCTTVNRLMDFLCCGVKNRQGQPANELCIDNCTFENEESLSPLCHFFDANKSPKTLQKVKLRRLMGGAQVYERLLSSLHKNKTITELSLGDDNIAFPHRAVDDAALGGATGGQMVGNLLQRNTTLTTLKLTKCLVNVKFIRAMRNGLLTSRSRLKSLSLRHVSIDNKVLYELRVVYAHNHRHNTILSELDLGYNNIQGRVGGNHLRRLQEKARYLIQ